MDYQDYVKAVADYYMCDTNIAKKIIESSKLNNGNSNDIDNIVRNYFESKGKNI